MATSGRRRTLSNTLASALLPGRFLATQLRRPAGRFGRWVMVRGLNDGNAELIDAALDALSLQADQSLLDVGFGGGRALRRAAERTRGPLWGVDFSPDMVAAAARNLGDLVAGGRLNVLTADAARLPLRDGLVDTVITTNTIYFWPDLAGVLGELRRVLAQGGQLAIGYTGRDKMRRFEHVTRHGFRTFMPEDLEPAMRAAGFENVRSEALQGGLLDGDFVSLSTRGTES